MITSITITGRNLNDLFNLPVTKSIHKISRDNFTVELYSDMVQSGKNLAYKGDAIMQLPNGKWIINSTR